MPPLVFRGVNPGKRLAVSLERPPHSRAHLLLDFYSYRSICEEPKRGNAEVDVKRDVCGKAVSRAHRIEPEIFWSGSRDLIKVGSLVSRRDPFECGKVRSSITA